MAFFTTGFRRPKKYEYQPLYYNQEKEERELRRNRVRSRGKIKDAEMPEMEEQVEQKEMFKSTFSSKFQDYKNMNAGSWDNFSKVRRIIILVSLGLIIAMMYLIVQAFPHLSL